MRVFDSYAAGPATPAAKTTVPLVETTRISDRPGRIPVP